MTEQQQTIKYKQRVSFSQIDNALICSNEISGTAFKLWCYLFSRPENWTFYWSDILPKMKEGRNAVKNAAKELEELGYLSKEQKKVFTGRGKEWRWGGMDISLFWDPLTNPNFNPSLEPKPSSPLTENGLSGNPSSGNEKSGDEIAGNGSTNKNQSKQYLTKQYLLNFLALPAEEKKDFLKKEFWDKLGLRSSLEKYCIFRTRKDWKGFSNLEADVMWWENGFVEKNPLPTSPVVRKNQITDEPAKITKIRNDIKFQLAMANVPDAAQFFVGKEILETEDGFVVRVTNERALEYREVLTKINVKIVFGNQESESTE